MLKIKVITGILLLFCISNNLNAQEKTEEVKSPETVIIRITELQCKANGLNYPINVEPNILIIDPDGAIEEKALDKVNLFSAGETSFQNNAAKIKLEIQKWHNKGFQVKAMNSTGECFTITTIILQKN